MLCILSPCRETYTTLFDFHITRSRDTQSSWCCDSEGKLRRRKITSTNHLPVTDADLTKWSHFALYIDPPLHCFRPINLVMSTTFEYSKVDPMLTSYCPLYFSQDHKTHASLLEQAEHDTTVLGTIIRASERNPFLEPWEKDEVLTALQWCAPTIMNKIGTILFVFGREEEQEVAAWWLKKFATACGVEKLGFGCDLKRYGKEEEGGIFSEEDLDALNWYWRKYAPPSYLRKY